MEAIVNRQEQLSEIEIIHRVIGGDKHLYELIIRKYNPRLYRVGMSIVNDDMEVEELMQIAYIKAYENLPKFEHRSSFSTWLTRILMNECFQHLKKKQRTSFDSEMQYDGNKYNDMKTPDRVLLNKELGKALESALTQLPEKYRVVFVMREMEEMSIAETVDALGISESNVKVRLNRAKSMLRDSVASFYKNDKIYAFHLVRCDRIVQYVMSRIS